MILEQRDLMLPPDGVGTFRTASRYKCTNPDCGLSRVLVKGYKNLKPFSKTFNDRDGSVWDDLISQSRKLYHIAQKGSKANMSWTYYDKDFIRDFNGHKIDKFERDVTVFFVE